MDSEERKEAEEDLKREDSTRRVTLAIADKSAELAFCDGYRTGIYDMAAIVLAALSLWAIVHAMASE
jgi:hypothetical protein